MNDTNVKTIDQVQAFLAGTSAVEFSISSKGECYKWIEQVLIRLNYPSCGKTEKGLVLDLIGKVSGYSRIQSKRLVKQYLRTGRLARRQRTAHKEFARKYTQGDIRLLARTAGFPVLEPRSYANGPGRSSTRPNMSVLRAFQWRTYTT